MYKWLSVTSEITLIVVLYIYIANRHEADRLFIYLSITFVFLYTLYYTLQYDIIERNIITVVLLYCCVAANRPKTSLAVL